MEFKQDNALSLLRRELHQLEGEIYQKKKQMQSLRHRLERATAHLHLTQQQVDLFRHETQTAQERMKAACDSLTRELCEELVRVGEPGEELKDLADQFLLLLERKERSWPAFQANFKLFHPLKARMESVSAANLTEDQLTALLPVWKNQHQLQSSLHRTAKGAACIVHWISYCVEFKLKMETLSSAQKAIPDLEYKIKKCVAAIAENMKEISALEAQQTRLQAKIEGEVVETPFSPSDQSQNSLRSTNIHAKSRSDVIEGSPRPQYSDFPNFSSKKLYGETPAQGEVDFGESSEYCAGCKGKLFCF